MKYRYQDADGWHVQTVDGGGGEVGYYASLAVDKQGDPHISYRIGPHTVKYAYQDANGWNIQMVDRG